MWSLSTFQECLLLPTVLKLMTTISTNREGFTFSTVRLFPNTFYFCYLLLLSLRNNTVISWKYYNTCFSSPQRLLKFYFPTQNSAPLTHNCANFKSTFSFSSFLLFKTSWLSVGMWGFFSSLKIFNFFLSFYTLWKNFK